jgi:hypothetical protein
MGVQKTGLMGKPPYQNLHEGNVVMYCSNYKFHPIPVL